MLASFPASMLNQNTPDLGIPNRFSLDPSRSSLRRAFPQKRKGLQLALEPLNGRGIAGYVPEP